MRGGSTAGPKRGRLAAPVVALALAAAHLGAQDATTASVDLVGGAFQYDLRGTGTVPFGGLRASLPLHRWIVAEPGLAYTSYTSQSGVDIGLLTAEVQLQGRLALGRFAPFLGVGAGGVLDLREDRGTGELLVSTYSAGAGVRTWLGPGWSARAELRVRAIDAFAGAAAEWTLGVGRAF